MEQPKLAITRMAKRLRRKVVDMEEYLKDNQAPDYQTESAEHMSTKGITEN